MALPPEHSPPTRSEESRMFVEWEGERARALAAKKDELVDLDRIRSIDKSEIIERFQASFIRVLQSELEDMDTLYDDTETNPIESPAIGWIPITELTNREIVPVSIKFPSEEGIKIKSWTDILVEISEWLIRENRITDEDCPIIPYGNRCLINNVPRHPDGQEFCQSKELSNGLHLFSQHPSWQVLLLSRSLLRTYYGENLSQIRVQLPHNL